MTPAARKPIDIAVENFGTVFLLRPGTAKGARWLAANIVADEAQRYGPAIAVEHRYVGPIVRGALKDDLVVR